MKFFTTPSSKNIIATLRIVTIEISELTFLLILNFHVKIKEMSMKKIRVFNASNFFDFLQKIHRGFLKIGLDSSSRSK